jgi:hypothetical protein
MLSCDGLKRYFGSNLKKGMHDHQNLPINISNNI